MIRAFLRLLGVLHRRTSEAANVEELATLELKPLDLSPSERALVEWKIFEFIENPPSDCARYRDAVARANALPLYFDWTAWMALCPDGQVVWVPYDDERGPVEKVRDECTRNVGLFRGTKLHPELLFLAPKKPVDAIECPGCRGTGKIMFEQGYVQLSEKLVCTCGGSGWLPRSARSS